MIQQNVVMRFKFVDCFRIKNKQAGLFYIPSRRIKCSREEQKYGWKKSNWSKTGKIYSSIGRANAAAKAALTFGTIKSLDEVEIEVV